MKNDGCSPSCNSQSPSRRCTSASLAVNAEASASGSEENSGTVRSSEALIIGCALAPSRCGARHRVEHLLVDVAPAPALAGLQGSHHGMPGRAEMLARMAIRRVVAEADVAAYQAQAQVNPGTAHFQALLAAVRRWCHRRDLAQVLAGVAI